MSKDQIAQKISAALLEQFPETNPMARNYAAYKIATAVEMAVDKLQERHIDLQELSKDQMMVMMDWCLRLAFGSHMEDVDQQALTSMVIASAANEPRFAPSYL